MAAERRIILLGATGSIGRQTVEVLGHLNALAERSESPVRYRVVGLAAGSNDAELAALAAKFDCRDVALSNGGPGGDWPEGTRLRRGATAPERLVREVDADLVLAAMVGFAGLPATLAAVELGRDVALANKETLVAAGELVVAACKSSGAKLLPVDSEHAGVWQAMGPSVACGDATPAHSRGTGVPPVSTTSTSSLPSSSSSSSAPPLHLPPSISKVTLTASGGPFRTWTAAQIAAATPQQALNHPTWRMGPKVTIDSASLMNKALELIEARWLFGLDAARLGVLVHPQSIVHAIVEFADGAMLAQLGAPDMRGPIQRALTWPDITQASHRRVGLEDLRRLDFEPVDRERFPAVALAERAIVQGGTAGAILNAANEVAAEAFLAGSIPFPRIAQLVAGALDAISPSRADTVEAVSRADAVARDWIRRHLAEDRS